MKAKEEAIELVDKFTLYLGTDVNGDECYVDIIEAKQCALICVDEMLEIQYNWGGIDGEQYLYLQEVKQEINKL